MTMVPLIGFVIGLLLAVPAGPAAVLIVKNTGQYSPRAGLSSLAGLLLAEVIYIALFLSGLYPFLVEQQQLFAALQIGGAMLVLFIGYRGLKGRSKPPSEPLSFSELHKKQERDAQRMVTTLMITLFNPAILLFMIGALSTLASYLGRSPNFNETLNLLVFMEFGCMAWFIALIYFTARIRQRFLRFFSEDLQRYSAWTLILLGVFMLIGQMIK
jgi:putative LysE/RhtB family amino acid efflux pump